jgi:hypothetical protein
MPRWTVRNVNAESIRAVQELSADSGVGLGEIVSEAIEFGLDHVRARLLSTSTASEPEPKIGRLDEIFTSIRLLSDVLRSANSK